MKNWGYLRESKNACKEDWQTGLEEYLAVIFPETTDWVHDKSIPDLTDLNGEKTRIRPDYRSESLKLIVEFDGLPHYRYPESVNKDFENQQIYEAAGYRVVRVPYFIQLTNQVVKQLFRKDVEEPLFDDTKPSIGLEWPNTTPAYLCLSGALRMAREYAKFPQQYEVNIKHLQETDPENFTEHRFLSEMVQKFL